MDIKEKNQLYTIICKLSEKDIKGLSLSNKREILFVKNYLSTSLTPTKCKRVKQLRSSVSNFYERYIGDKALRLTFTINEDTHKLFIEEINTRTRAFNPNR